MERTIETTAGELPELIRKYRLTATERVRVSFESHLTENGLTPEQEDEILSACAEKYLLAGVHQCPGGDRLFARPA